MKTNFVVLWQKTVKNEQHTTTVIFLAHNHRIFFESLFLISVSNRSDNNRDLLCYCVSRLES
jgi:hypothetical protein